MRIVTTVHELQSVARLEACNGGGNGESGEWLCRADMVGVGVEGEVNGAERVGMEKEKKCGRTRR